MPFARHHLALAATGVCNLVAGKKPNIADAGLTAEEMLYTHPDLLPRPCRDPYRQDRDLAYRCGGHSLGATAWNVHETPQLKQFADGDSKDQWGNVCCMHVDEGLVNNATAAPTWFANGGDDYYSLTFSVKNIDGLPDGQWQGTPKDYTTSVVGNRSIEWIRKVSQGARPFFAYSSTKAPHHGQGEFAEAPLTEDVVGCIDHAFKQRWRALMPVDDLVSGLLDTVDELGIAGTTYASFSSDHGFQLGELNLPQDKRHMYDFDVRIPLLALGPGIPAGSSLKVMATNVDLAPTYLALAGVSPLPQLDGRNLLPFIVPSPLDDIANLPDVQRNSRHGSGQGWRDTIYISHYAVGNKRPFCGPGHMVNEADNNFIAIRALNTIRFSNLTNFAYAEFQ
eukprot:gene2380-3185_t